MLGGSPTLIPAHPGNGAFFAALQASLPFIELRPFECPAGFVYLLVQGETDVKRPHFILNPAASAGETGRSQGRLLKLIEDRFPEGFTLDITTRPGHATEITRKAISEGVELIVAIGGDGTMNEVINGFFTKGKLLRKTPRLGLLCSGTAEDVVRNLGLPKSLKEQIEVTAGKRTRLIDLGKVTFTTKEGEKKERFYINDCNPGIAAKVVQRVTPELKRLGGFLAFGLASTYTALTYRGHGMTITLDEEKTISGRFLGVAVANGRYAGGGMDFAPNSRMDDGLLDVVMIRDQSVPARLFNFPKIYSGKHINLSWITYLQARRVRIESNQRVALEADGEWLGFLPCEVTLMPKALKICVG